MANGFGSFAQGFGSSFAQGAQIGLRRQEIKEAREARGEQLKISQRNVAVNERLLGLKEAAAEREQEAFGLIQNFEQGASQQLQSRSAGIDVLQAAEDIAATPPQFRAPKIEQFSEIFQGATGRPLSPGETQILKSTKPEELVPVIEQASQDFQNAPTAGADAIPQIIGNPGQIPQITDTQREIIKLEAVRNGQQNIMARIRGTKAGQAFQKTLDQTTAEINRLKNQEFQVSQASQQQDFQAGQSAAQRAASRSNIRLRDELERDRIRLKDDLTREQPTKDEKTAERIAKSDGLKAGTAEFERKVAELLRVKDFTSGVDSQSAKNAGELAFQTAKDVRGDLAKAQKGRPILDAMRNLNAEVPEGALAPIITKGASALKSLGIENVPGFRKGDTPGQAQAFSSLTQQMVNFVREQGLGSQSDAELKALLEVVPALSQTVPGRAMITEMLDAVFENSIERGAVLTNHLRTGEGVNVNFLLKDDDFQKQGLQLITPERQQVIDQITSQARTDPGFALTTGSALTAAALASPGLAGAATVPLAAARAIGGRGLLGNIVRAVRGSPGTP